MKKYEQLVGLLPIIYPVFYIKKDRAGNEFIFLDEGRQQENILIEISDKTQCEAVENHFHLFDRVSKENKVAVKKICVSIAKNLLQTLTQTFPDKKFIVYLQINNNDSIIRFHQIWNEEPLYFDVKQLRNKDGTEIFEYKYEPGPT